LISAQLDHHRYEQIQSGQHRLNSLQESLGVTFQQLSALPKALGRQNAINQFLSTMQIEWSSAMSDAERAELTKALTQRPEVRDISSTLRETGIDFQVTQIYLTDPFGTIVADSLFETSVNNIGGNRRTRQYFTEAIDSGSGTQFLVGKVTKVPGFYFFSARRRSGRAHRGGHRQTRTTSHDALVW
jgi:C4-dicarboxylate-specific signal transduction histidine kinase